MLDRLIVNVIALTNAPVYPLARAVASLIYTRPDEWTLGTHEMSHDKVGRIWTANKAYGITVETRAGKWNPTWLERRIIRNAADWRIKCYVRNQVMKALGKNLLTEIN